LYTKGSFLSKTSNPTKSSHITNTINFTTSDLETLWHFQLGHASNKCIDVIKNNFPFVKYDKSFVCDVCHFAKQKRLLFSLSASLLLNRTNLLFVIFVNLQSKKDFSFLLVHLNLKDVSI